MAQITLEEVLAGELRLKQGIKEQEELVANAQEKIKRYEDELHAYQRSNIPVLYWGAFRLLKEVEETPVSILVLDRFDGSDGHGEPEYTRFSLLKISDGRMRASDRLSEGITSIEELLSKTRDNENIGWIYENLREFVIKYSKKTEKEVKP